jgi:nitroreductase
MELYAAMQSAFTCRYYRPDPVPDDVLARVLSAARFAPTGGNRQPVRFVVVKDAEKKRQLGEWYRVPWKAYMQGVQDGQINVGADYQIVENADHFADHFEDVPAIIVVCAELASLHVTDGDLGRVPIVGGCSVYPAVENLLLKARELGLGAALTTLLCIYEPQVKELLGIPDEIITAAHVPIGWPAKPFPKKLNRRPLSEVAFLDSYGAVLPGA